MAKNKIANRRKKEGLIWVNSRTDQLRFSSSKDRPINFIQPLEVYKAGEKILRGEAVSVATSEDTQKILENLGKGYDVSSTYIVKTNTNYHKKALGLALEPAEPGDEVHIQNTGSFTFLVGSDSTLEYTPSFTEENIGATVYVKGTGQASEAGKLTVDSEESWKNYRNIISIGTITDTPLKGSAQKEIQISLNISGDQRGLLDATQFECVTGEAFTVPSSSPIKVLAVGQENYEKLQGYISFEKSKEVGLSPYYIGFSTAEGQTVFIRFGSTQVPPISETFDLSDLDSTFVRTALKYTNGDPSKIKVIDCGFLEHTLANHETFTSKLIEAITEALESIGCSDVKVTPDFVKDWVNLNFEAEQTKTFISMYISGGHKFFQHNLEKTGSQENKGKVVVADSRYGVRSEVLGIYYSGNYDQEIPQGSHVIVQKEGLFVIPKDSSYKLIPGELYYLGFAGEIVPRDQVPTYLSSMVKIGKALSETELSLDIGDNREYQLGSLPIGYVKSSVNNAAEYGFLLCDGETELDVTQYPELYARLRQQYSEEQLSVKTEVIG